jgi:hypothetical protein
MRAKCALICALCSAPTISASHRSAISGGTPAGTEKPKQLAATTPANPASRKVGMSGRVGHPRLRSRQAAGHGDGRAGDQVVTQGTHEAGEHGFS